MRKIDSNQADSGILDQATDEERRTSFLQHCLASKRYRAEEYEAVAAYISGPECVEDLKRLKRAEYFFNAPFHYRIPKNFSGEKRDVYAFKGKEKYLLSLLTYVLRDYDRVYPDGLYSFRTQVTARDFLLKLRDFQGTENYFIIKADVSNYVGSIVPELLLHKLKELWKQDPAFYGLLEFLLLRRECVERDGSLVKCEPGGMGGNPLSNHFMNVYLMDLDEYFAAKAPLYCRYSDDIIIFARDRAEAEEYLSFFYQVLNEKRLSTNPEKTILIEPGEKVDVLGIELENGRMDIAGHAKKKLKRKIRMQVARLMREKKAMHLSNREAAEKMCAYCNRLFFGIAGKNELAWARWVFPVITDTTSLKELDHYIQDAIRGVYWSSFSNKRYRTRFEDLAAMGYRSLVHAYYHSEINRNSAYWRN